MTRKTGYVSSVTRWRSVDLLAVAILPISSDLHPTSIENTDFSMLMKSDEAATLYLSDQLISIFIILLNQRQLLKPFSMFFIIKSIDPLRRRANR